MFKIKVPFGNLKKQYLSIKTDIDKSIGSIIDSSSFIRGDDVKEFERLTDKHINWGFKKELMTSGGRGFNKYTTGQAALRQIKVNMSNDLLYNFEDQMSRTKSVNWRPTTKQSKSI